MGWNATPTLHYAKGPNVLVESYDAERVWGLKVRSLSKRNPVPLGKDPFIDADWVVVCTKAIVNEVDPLLSASCSSIEPQDITASWKDASQQRSRSLEMQ